MLLSPATDQQSDAEQEHHDAIEYPAMAGPADHHSVGIGESSREHRDGKHLDEIRQRGRILKGVRPIGIEEAASVRAEILDDLQCRDRSLSNDLPFAFERSGVR